MSVHKTALAEEREDRLKRPSAGVLWAAVSLFGVLAAVVFFWDRFIEPEPARWTMLVLTAAGIGLLFLYRRLHAAESRREAERRREGELIAQSLFRHSPFPLAVLDADGRFTELNESVCQLLGYGREELIGQSFLPVVDAVSRKRTMELFADALDGRVHQRTMTVFHKSGYPVDIHITAIPLAGRGRTAGVIVVSQDVSDKKRQTERIRYMAYYDDMTGLPNRRMLMNHLEEMILRAREEEKLLTLMYLDVDRFKLVNDSFGRDFGDMLLLQVAERLTRGLAEYDMVARMEGDEFAVLYTGVSSMDEVHDKARRLQLTLEEPFELQGFPFNLSASIGIAVSSFADNDPGMLVKMADMALGRVKDQGKNDYLLYSEEWNNSSLERLTMQHELKRAIQRKEFTLYYQPQYHLVTGRIIGLEALVRWKHPERGMISPGVFIPVAEESGLIVQLGDWVLEEACRQNKAWQDAGLLTVPVSVNLSVRQFMQQNLPEKVAAVLRETGLKPEYLDLEITESMTMDVGYASSCLAELSKLGVCISMDDFGTGYSSFHYLKNFPINRLKIDQSFVRDIQQDPGDAAIVAAIIAMAHNLNLYVIAEGVETEGQMEFLKRHNCDEMQGYFWSPPVPCSHIPELLKSSA